MTPRKKLAPRSAALGFFAASLLLVTVFAGGAGAATTITQPTANPYTVKLDAAGKPEQFTIVATGFRAGSLVYVEQCDARAPSEPNWLPTRDCDIGSSPAAAIVDATGVAHFPAGDVNHGFQPFSGLGPEGLFNCLAPGAASVNNGLPDYRTCQIRVSSNNNAATADQAFLSITFGGSAAAGGSSKSSSSTSSSTGSIAVAVGAVVLVGALAAAFVFRRRARARAG